jgi:hypothetical protein
LISGSQIVLCIQFRRISENGLRSRFREELPERHEQVVEEDQRGRRASMLFDTNGDAPAI